MSANEQRTDGGSSQVGPPTCWGVVPAAGLGQRMQAELPKQYLGLAGATVLEHTLRQLLACNICNTLVVALHPQDSYWPNTLYANDARVVTVNGGAHRCDSVLAALQSLSGRAAPDDWVLVHDAARPCISQADLHKLRDAVLEDAVGGLLALPVTDTVKQSGPGQRVAKTLDRDKLWLAQTPQMFRFGSLLDALTRAIDAGIEVTDEAAAIELAGLAPRLVAGDPRNIKITHAVDLALAEAWLAETDEVI